MFLGPGIVGNRVIVETDERQFAVLFSLGSLTTSDPAGIRIRPEHIHVALRQFAGIAEHPHSLKFPLGGAAAE